MPDRVRPEDVDAMLLGATLLGSGGGGDAAAWRHRVLAGLPSDGIELLPLAQAEARGVRDVAAVGMAGATSVLVEKLPHGSEIGQAVGACRRWSGSRIDALLPVEAAGLNAALAVSAACELGLPLLDVDLMGRALPRFDQLTLVADGPEAIRAVALADTGGQVLVLDGASPPMLERAVRAYVSIAGGWAGACFGPVSVAELAARCCEGTLARAIRLGRVLQRAEEGSDDPDALADALGGVVLGTGRVVDIARGVAGQPNRARIAVVGRDGPVLRIESENEYLVVFADGEAMVTCPELVVLLDRRTARPIAADRLRRGDDVRVLALPGPSWWWASPDRLRVVGPRAFGLELDPLRLRSGRTHGETMPR